MQFVPARPFRSAFLLPLTNTELVKQLASPVLRQARMRAIGIISRDQVVSQEYRETLHKIGLYDLVVESDSESDYIQTIEAKLTNVIHEEQVRAGDALQVLKRSVPVIEPDATRHCQSELPAEIVEVELEYQEIVEVEQEHQSEATRTHEQRFQRNPSAAIAAEVQMESPVVEPMPPSFLPSSSEPAEPLPAVAAISPAIPMPITWADEEGKEEMPSHRITAEQREGNRLYIIDTNWVIRREDLAHPGQSGGVLPLLRDQIAIPITIVGSSTITASFVYFGEKNQIADHTAMLFFLLLGGAVMMLLSFQRQAKDVSVSRKIVNTTGAALGSAGVGAGLGAIAGPVAATVGAGIGFCVGVAYGWLSSSARRKCRICGKRLHHDNDRPYCPYGDGYWWEPNDIEVRADWLSEADVEVYVGVHDNLKKAEAKLVAKLVVEEATRMPGQTRLSAGTITVLREAFLAVLAKKDWTTIARRQLAA